MTISIDQPEVGPTTLRRLVAAWPRRATIRTDMAKVTGPEAYDPELADYPQSLLPFAEHPDFLGAPPEQRQRVNTLAWLAYNARVIAAEEHVANPTFEKLAHGVFPGLDRFEVKEAVQQSHIDEVWHTYMHMLAMERTRNVRCLEAEPTGYGHPVTNRTLYGLEAAAEEKWQRDLLYLLWTGVGEISINTFLDLVAADRTIQPMHALVTRLHSRDEAAHGPIMFEVMRDVFARMNKEQRAFLVRNLPDAIVAFAAEDYAMWLDLLTFAGVAHAAEIVADCRALPGSDLMVTDFGPVHRLVRELEIEHLVDFDFAAYQRS
jgi:4-aminobenzoate N-oxygenase